MSDKPATPPRKGSETGLMPKVDFDPDAPHESPQPPELPEIHGDATGITGQIPLYSEGQDAAKDDDDSATTDDQQPRQNRARRR
ncbi:MAG: hypothetical protein HZC41_22230 [Chloroflexi bacterium]|nr:hypothetical protein [Chloroflexota bacterium]